MKQLWLAIAALVLAASATSSHAQVSYAVGSRIGLNLGSCSVDPGFSAGITKGGRTGMIVGTVLEAGFEKMFYVVFEPQYVQKGFHVEGAAGKAYYKFNYLDLPLYFKVKFLKGKVRPYAFIGPDFGISLSSTLTYELTGRPSSDEDWKDLIGSDFSLDFGGGAELVVASKVSAVGDIRYMLGVKNIYSNPNEPNTSIKTGGFVVMFGALFYLD